VDSLNAAPLTRGLEDRVLFTAPARLAELEAIIAARRDYPAEFCREYLTRHIRFELGAEEKRGIEEFAARLRRLGNGPLYPPRYVPLPTR